MQEGPSASCQGDEKYLIVDLMLKDNVYTHNFEIDCGTDQVGQLFEVQHLTNICKNFPSKVFINMPSKRVENNTILPNISKKIGCCCIPSLQIVVNNTTEQLVKWMRSWKKEHSMGSLCEVLAQVFSG